MAQSINLIPKQEVEIQTEKKLLSVSTKLSFVLLGIVSLVTIVVLIIMFTTQRNISALDTDIASLRQEVESQSPLEIVARNLDKKYAVLTNILIERPYYSKLLKEFYARKPEGITIKELSLRDTDTLEVSGKAEVYLFVADFTNSLINANFENGDPKLKPLFKQVTLNSVSLESDGANFSISVKFDNTLLKEVL